jgi:endonuclease/exonuclease/phosphatase family metal-dependent hydrolase
MARPRFAPPAPIFALAAVVLLATTPGRPLLAGPPVVLDGAFDDWRSVEPVVIDPLDAEAHPVDLGAVRVTADGQFVYLDVDFGRVVNLQGIGGLVDLCFDADGDPQTGETIHDLPGVDLLVTLSPAPPDRPGRPGVGVSARYPGVPDATVGNRAYDLQWTSAPTYAADRFEMRLGRGSAADAPRPLFVAERCALLIQAMGGDGEVWDRVGPVALTLPRFEVGAVADSNGDPLARSPGTLRLVSWNVQRGALMSNPKPFRNVLRALEPDILLLQELTDQSSLDELQSMLEDFMPTADDRRWFLLRSRSGSNLRCVVASRLPLTEAEPIALLSYPDRPQRSVRMAAAIIHHRDRHLLACSVHMPCCGFAGDDRDLRRQVEASLIRDAIDRVGGFTTIDAVVIAGDFNLVGSRTPLDTLLEQTGLAVAPAVQLDGRTNATWADRGQPFGPGRLDFLLHSHPELEIVRSFTLDTADLAPGWLQTHQLDADDTTNASDHLPVVADVRWSGETR